MVDFYYFQPILDISLVLFKFFAIFLVISCFFFNILFHFQYFFYFPRFFDIFVFFHDSSASSRIDLRFSVTFSSIFAIEGSKMSLEFSIFSAFPTNFHIHLEIARIKTRNIGLLNQSRIEIDHSNEEKSHRICSHLISLNFVRSARSGSITSHVHSQLKKNNQSTTLNFK